MAKGIYFVGVLVGALMTLFSGQSAFATSVYDSIIHPTDTLRIQSTNGLYKRDISNSLLTTMQQYCNSAYYDSFVDTMNNGGGKWIVLNLGWWDNNESVRVIWSDDVNARTVFYPDSPGYSARVTHMQKYITLLISDSGIINCEVNSATGNNRNHNIATDACAPPGCYPSFEIYYSTFPVSYPSGYQGELIPGSSARDLDEDGLSDYIESPTYPNRNAVFCGSSECAYPNPAKKDLYVEIDWMKNGSITYKPTSAQLELIEDMFESKSVNIHFDTGQYGGGEELALYTPILENTPTSSQVDYWDYVNGGDGITPTFASSRNSIWRYLIYGYKYDLSGSSGWAETFGDNLFVSGGLISDMSGLANMDRAVAGTIAHELGHNICLSNERIYVEQPTDCAFSHIDSTDTNNDYKSVMNYRFQLTDRQDLGYINYSDGSHGGGDHDDWAAALKGMSGFSGTRTALGVMLANRKLSPDGSVIIEETVTPVAEERTSQGHIPLPPEDTNTGVPQGMSPTQGDQKYIPGPTAKQLAHESDLREINWPLYITGGLALVAGGASAYIMYIRTKKSR